MERERERERDRDRDRDRETETETDRQTDRDRDTDRQTDRQRQRGLCVDDIPLVEFMYLVFTRIPGESYHRRLMPLLLFLCDACRALINSLVVILMVR